MKQPLLGIHVSELRNKKGLTQKDLAEACKVDIRTIQRIEAGEVLPRAYTLKLLEKALDSDMTGLNSKTREQNVWLAKQIRWAYTAAIIFSINYLPVMFHFVVKPFSPSVYIPIIIIHILSFIYFARGFYLSAKRSDNQIMVISSLLSMILWPLVNTMQIFKSAYFGLAAYNVFTIACITSLIYGISLLIEANRTASGAYLYRIAGISTIIQSGLILSLNHDALIAGAIISTGSNIMLTYILYLKTRNKEIPQGKARDIPSFA